VGPSRFFFPPEKCRPVFSFEIYTVTSKFQIQSSGIGCLFVPPRQVPRAFGFWRFGLLGGEGRLLGFKHRQNPLRGLLPDFRHQLTSLAAAVNFL
jgi:hypothetical protein